MSQTFAQRILEARKRKGYSQELLAQYLGVTSRSVQRWEAGRSLPCKELAFSVAKLLNTTEEQVLAYIQAEKESIPDQDDSEEAA